MKLTTFEKHTIWVALADTEYQLNAIQGSDDRLDPEMDTEFRLRIAFFKSVFRSRGRSHALFSEQMFTEAHNYLNSAFSSLETAMGYSGANRLTYAQQALGYLQEASRFAIRDWPNPTPTAKEVQQGESIVDALLEAQVAALASLDSAIADRQSEVAEVEAALAEARKRMALVATEVDATVERAIATVDAQKLRIDSVIDDGTRATAEIPAEVTRKFDEWSKVAEDKFGTRFDPLARRSHTAVKEAEAAMERIAETEKKYQTLVNLDTADRLAGHYDKEARGLRVSAVIAYFVAVVSIVAAAIPLGVSIADQLAGAGTGDESRPFDWGVLATRALFALLLGGVATVGVRVASRLLSQASACKRFAMEMRTFEPFLSGAEEGAVNAARLALVSQAFGKAYVGNSDQKPTASGDEVVNVSAFEKVVDLVAKLATRGA